MEPLSDPLKDRVIKTLKPPPHQPISQQLLFPENPSFYFLLNYIDQDIPHWNNLKEHLTNGGLIAKQDVLTILKLKWSLHCYKYKIHQLLLAICMGYLKIKLKYFISQYYDLLQILETGGNPETTQYFFLGDFVDRGTFSIECLLLAYSLKIAFPKTIHIIRGNHESREMTQNFNFRKEVLCKFDQETYEIILETFGCLPLAAIINGKIFACHGGISPSLNSINKINQINRFCEPPTEGGFCDLLWADPYPEEQLSQHILFQANQVRGCSYIFGNDALNTFFQMNNLTMVIRGHEVQQDGFKAYYWLSKDNPSVITLFSAPNYCDVYNNLGAILQITNGNLKVIQIKYSDHPYFLPDFLDVFSWSAVFIAEQVCNMFKSILSNAGKMETFNEKEYQFLIEQQEKQADIQTKIQKLKQQKMKQEQLTKQTDFMKKLMARQEKERIQNEELIKMNGGCIDDKLPRSEILKKLSKDSQKNLFLSKQFQEKANFNLALEYDIKNEKRPKF